MNALLTEYLWLCEALLHYTLSDIAHWQQLGSKSKSKCTFHILCEKGSLTYSLPNSHFQKFSLLMLWNLLGFEKSLSVLKL